MSKPFKLLADHPALDFVNTLDNRFAASGAIEGISSYADLLRFAEQAALVNRDSVSALEKKQRTGSATSVFIEALQLREALAAVFYGILAERELPTSAIKVIQERVLDACEHRQLEWRPACAGDPAVSRAAWGWGRHAASLQLPVWELAQSAVHLLTSSALDNVHECGSMTCRWLFLDSSKNHSRRWCDMKICGNRMKARRFQARRE